MNWDLLPGDKFSVVTDILVKWTVIGLSSVDMEDTIAWERGSADVFDDGIMIPKRIGPRIVSNYNIKENKKKKKRRAVYLILDGDGLLR